VSSLVLSGIYMSVFTLSLSQKLIIVHILRLMPRFPNTWGATRQIPSNKIGLPDSFERSDRQAWC
jgi:hypothetical protein